MSRGPTILDSRGNPAVHSAPSRRAIWAPGGYQAAGWSKARSHIWTHVADSKREITPWTRIELLRKSRFFKKNVGMIRGMAKSLVDHAIGPGVYPIPCTRDDAWNERAWKWFWELAKIGDVTGKMTLWETQRMRTGAKFWDGELFTMHVQSAAGWPQYQVIRGHNCGNFGDVNEKDGWVDGVKLDGVGRARAYRFKLRDDDRYTTVPAGSVVHSYLLEETDQVRGITPLAPVLNKLHDIMDALSLEMGSVKEQSRVARVITTESGEDEDVGQKHFKTGAGVQETSAEEVALEELFGAEVKHLRLGEKLEQLGHNRPSPTFTGFIDYIGRDVTVSTGFPYEFSWSPGSVPSSAVRFILEKVRVACDEWRRNEWEDTYPFYTFAIATAIEMGELPPNPEWWMAEPLAGAEDVTIDKGRDSRSAIENVKAALDNFKRYFARRGLWWKTELRQKAMEAAFIRDLAREFDVPEDRIHQMTANSGGTSGPNDAEQPDKPSKQEQEEEDAA